MLFRSIKRYQRDPQTMLAPASLRAVHPLGKSPVITDNDLTLAESGAIIEYLIDRYGEGRLSPQNGTPEHLRYIYWLHYAEGSLMPPLLLNLTFSEIVKRSPFLVRPIILAISQSIKNSYITPQITLHLNYLESELANSDWFVGSNFTAADIQMSFPLETAADRASLARLYPF